MRWDVDGRHPDEGSIDLTPDGEVLVMVDEQRRQYWAQQTTSIKQEPE